MSGGEQLVDEIRNSVRAAVAGGEMSNRDDRWRVAMREMRQQMGELQREVQSRQWGRSRGRNDEAIVESMSDGASAAAQSPSWLWGLAQRVG